MGISVGGDSNKGIPSRIRDLRAIEGEGDAGGTMAKSKRRLSRPTGHLKRKAPKARPQKAVTVPMGRDARRRVRLGVVLVDCMMSNRDPHGVVRIPANELVAKDADGANAIITSAEIEAFAARMIASGKVQEATKVEGGYALKIASRQPQGAAVQGASRPGTASRREAANGDQLMRAVLYAAAAGAAQHKQIRTRVLAGLGIKASGSTMNGTMLASRLAACVARHCSLGNLRRDGKLLLLTEVGKTRLDNPTPFSSKELPKGLGGEPDKSAMPTKRTPMTRAKTSQVLTAIRRMPPDRLMVVWNNAIRTLADPSKRMDNDAALRIVEAVENAWDALELANDDYFKWPSTETGNRTSGTAIPEMQKDGMLSYLEYHVGKTADIPAAVRHSILARVFEGKLPRVFPLDYMRQWGEPKTSARLRKMAESIASCTRSAKRRDEDRLDEAIRQWEQDLEFLYQRYYVGRFGFGWPSTSIYESVRVGSRL
jgi:hypothetical protein